MKNKKVLFSLVVLVILFLVALITFNYIHFTYYKGDIDENGNFHRYRSTLKMSVYTDPNDGHNEYKIKNNTHVFLKNLRKGDIIGMPNVYGCSQLAIMQNSQALVYHYSSSASLFDIENVIEKYISLFNDKDEVYVTLLHSDIDDNAPQNIEKLIKRKIEYYLNKDAKIEKTLYAKVKNDKSYAYQFKATITDDGFVNELKIKSNILALRLQNELYQGAADLTSRIRFHDMNDEYFIVAYADKKIMLYRQNMKEGVPVTIFSNFGNSIPQIHLILPRGQYQNANIRKQLSTVADKKFSRYSLKEMYYPNKNYNAHYNGQITKKGLKGRIKRY